MIQGVTLTNFGWQVSNFNWVICERILRVLETFDVNFDEVLDQGNSHEAAEHDEKVKDGDIVAKFRARDFLYKFHRGAKALGLDVKLETWFFSYLVAI